jgi:hypothetical protein
LFLCSCSKSNRKRKKDFPHFFFHLHFVFPSGLLQERVCGGTTTPQERFCAAFSPIRTILWSVTTHKDDLLWRRPSLARTTNSRTVNLFSLTLT